MAHGDCGVPQGWAEDPRLGTWVNRQLAGRKALDRGDPRPGMTAARVAKLTALGFDWQLPFGRRPRGLKGAQGGSQQVGHTVNISDDATSAASLSPACASHLRPRPGRRGRSHCRLRRLTDGWPCWQSQRRRHADQDGEGAARAGTG
jgi:hypothetical protein